MIVCVCNNVSDKEIECFKEDCACLTDLQEQIDIANCCGCCETYVEGLLNTEEE